MTGTRLLISPRLYHILAAGNITLWTATVLGTFAESHRHLYWVYEEYKFLAAGIRNGSTDTPAFAAAAERMAAEAAGASDWHTPLPTNPLNSRLYSLLPLGDHRRWHLVRLGNDLARGRSLPDSESFEISDSIDLRTRSPTLQPLSSPFVVFTVILGWSRASIPVRSSPSMHPLDRIVSIRPLPSSSFTVWHLKPSRFPFTSASPLV